MCEVDIAKATKDPYSFTLCLPGVSRSPVPPRAVVMLSPLGLSITAFRRSSFSSPQSFVGSQTWVSSTTMVRRLHSVDCHYTLFKGWGHLRVNPGLGILVHLSTWLNISSSNLLYRENFFQSTQEVGMV